MSKSFHSFPMHTQPAWPSASGVSVSKPTPRRRPLASLVSLLRSQPLRRFSSHLVPRPFFLVIQPVSFSIIAFYRFAVTSCAERLYRNRLALWKSVFDFVCRPSYVCLPNVYCRDDETTQTLKAPVQPLRQAYANSTGTLNRVATLQARSRER